MASSHRILVPLATGFEEVEAVAIIDVLRRAGLEVVSAALAGSGAIGSHGIRIEADAELGELELDTFTAIVLPGGMPGTTNLMQDERVIGLVQRLAREGRTIAAICAAPLVLEVAGVLGGREFTCHPSVRERMPAGASEARVVVRGNLFTSRGPGTALEFALELVSHLVGLATARELEDAMLVARG